MFGQTSLTNGWGSAGDEKEKELVMKTQVAIFQNMSQGPSFDSFSRTTVGEEYIHQTDLGVT